MVTGLLVLFALAYQIILLRNTNRFEKPYLTTIMTAIIVVSVIAISGVMCLCASGRFSIEQIFLASYLVVGILYILVLPPFSAPDEAKHLATAYYYANPAGVSERLDPAGRVVVRETDTILTHEDNHFPKASTYEIVSREFWKGAGNKAPASFTEPPLNVPFTAYIPQEAGVWLGSLLGLSGVATHYLMKVLMLIAAAIGGYFTIRLAPVGKMVFFTVYFLPMTLSLMTSANYDSTENVLALLLTAYILKMRYEIEKVGLRDYIPVLVISLVMVPIKVVYILLLFMLLMIPASKYRSKGEFALLFGGTLAVNALAILALRMSTLAGLVVTGDTTTVAAHWTLGQILSDIPHAIATFVYSFYEQLTFYYNTMMGASLGWLELSVPQAIIAALTVVLLMSVFVKVKGERTEAVTRRERIICGLIFAALFCGITLAMWLDNTPMDKEVIQGVQGRYFIPALPMILIIFRGEKIKLDEVFARYMPVALVVLNVFAMSRVFEIISTR